MSKYEYKCMTCDHIYWFDHGQTYKNCTKCEYRGELRLKSIQHDDFQADVEMQEMKTEQIIEEKDEEDEITEDELSSQLYGVDNNPEVIHVHKDEIDDEEPEIPEGGWECSECGAPVKNMNDVCSRNCFNAMMR